VSDTFLLRANSLSVRFHRGGAFAVRDISLTVSPGECVALVGPNGAGKSTLLRALAGLSPEIVTGTVTIGDTEIGRLSARELATRRAFVAQDNPMPFAFTVREAVSLGATADDVDDALARFDLSGFAERSVLALSGGERQRVALARAWAQNAALLFLDEPTAHQDLRHAQSVLSSVRAYVQERPTERTAIAVLHDLNLATFWADKVLLLQKGETVAFGSPQTVLTAETLSQVYETPVHTAPFIRAL